MLNSLHFCAIINIIILWTNHALIVSPFKSGGSYMKYIDMHCDTIFELQRQSVSLRENDLHIDLKKLKEADSLIQNFALYVPLRELDENDKDITPTDKNPLKDVLTLADIYYHELEKNKDLIAPVFTYADIEKNTTDGKLSALLTIEEGGVCLGNLSVLRMLHRLGVRMMTLTWNFPNEIGYPNVDLSKLGDIPMSSKNVAPVEFTKADTIHGLTETGIAFVEEMNRLGMIVDVSHLSDAGFYDVLKYSKKPFVASHSNARSVCSAVRNLTDDMIKKLGDSGSVTGLNFCADFLTDPIPGKENPGTMEAIVAHAKHITNVGGMECLGLGSDFDGIATNQGIPSTAYMPQLCETLKKGGFSENDIEKIFYKNVLRVYKENF